MTVTTGARDLRSPAASFGCSSDVARAYSSSRTAWKPKAEAMSSIISKSRRWLIVTICPSSLKAKLTISLAGTFRMFASSETVMNSVTRTSVFSRSFSSRRFCSSTSRKLGPSSRRCGPFLATGPPAHRRLLEQRGGALLERRLLLLVHGLGGLERLARLQLALRLDRRLGLGLRLDRGHLGRGAAAALGSRIRRRRRYRLGRLDGAAPLGGRGRVLLLPLLALPARPHQRPLLGLKRREVAAHKDVLLLEHAHELLSGDPEFSRQIVNPRRRHSLLQRPDQPARQRGIRHADGLHRRPPQPRPQPLRHRTHQHRHPPCPREALDFLTGAQACVRREHDARQGVPLQLGPHAGHPHHDAPATAAGAQPQQPDQPVAHATGAGVSPAGSSPRSPLPPTAPLSPTAPGAASSSPPSSVISFRKAMSLSAISGVMPAILSTSSRSRSRISCRVLWPARSSASTSSTGRPFSSRSETLVAASSSAGGSGAKSGPSPPRSNHSRLE